MRQHVDGESVTLSVAGHEPVPVWFIKRGGGYLSFDDCGGEVIEEMLVDAMPYGTERLADQVAEGDDEIESWTLVPSAVRAAEQARLAKFEALAVRVHEWRVRETSTEGRKWLDEGACLALDLEALAALAPPAPPEGEQT